MMVLEFWVVENGPCGLDLDGHCLVHVLHAVTEAEHLREEWAETDQLGWSDVVGYAEGRWVLGLYLGTGPWVVGVV